MINLYFLRYRNNRALIFLSFIISFPVLSFPNPEIVLSSPSINFGTIDQETITSQTLLIQNEGPDVLTILSAGPLTCCPLFDYEIEKTEIESCSQTALNIFYYDNGYRGDLKEKAVIQCNDPQTPQIEIYISATVRPHIAILPRRCKFVNPDRETDQKCIIIKYYNENNFTISKVLSPLKAIPVKMIPLKESVILNVSLYRRNLSKDQLSKELNIVLFLEGLSEEKKINIPVIIKTE